ncbi:MAG TPA: methionyl-tRNA formyltransferase [Bacteroidales bacterium]|nr:methionyl-tRNA formyltransferase [Bacteroidales bacterium]HPT09663.1 methionyl-tRNA formyltransferase [Bacteroidales bacterium]
MFSPRIIFFGTPDFAVASLKRLIAENYAVVAVVTAPDRPAGRGLKLKPSPVKSVALEYNIPVLQPVKLRDPFFLNQLDDFHADLQIVIAFRMLPHEVWSKPPLGTFNLHASLLPQYRGAAPVQWALINGEKETGVTTFLLDEKIDEGRILLHEKLIIGEEETAGLLHDRLMDAGAGLVIRTIEGLVSGTLHPTAQPTIPKLRQAPKINKEDCRIRWDQPAQALYNFIRGLSPYPGAFAEWCRPNGEILHLKILKATPLHEPFAGRPGQGFTDGHSWLKFGTTDGFISILELQLSGRKAMTVADFLRGYGKVISEILDC